MQYVNFKAPDFAYIYNRGEYLGRVTVSPADCRRLGNWRDAALVAARRVFGVGTFHVTSAPYEED